jgi:hypothetical protein
MSKNRVLKKIFGPKMDKVIGVVLVGTADGRKPLGKCRCSGEGNIKVDLQEVGWEGMD